MAGYGDSSTRIANGVVSDLYVHCIAVSDDDNNTILIMQVDNVGTPVEIAKNIYAGIKKRCGVPEDHVFFINTHTHSGVDLSYAGRFSTVALYVNFYVNTIVNNAILAMNDRAPVSKMYYGEINVPNHSWVRHYWAEVNGEVKAVGDNHNMEGWYSDADASVKKLLSHVNDIDRVCRIVKFDRTDDSLNDIMFINFRVHNLLYGGTWLKTHWIMTADIAGEIVNSVEAAMPGISCCYLQGDSGDINPRSNFTQDGSMPEEVYTEDLKEYADTFKDYVVSACANMKEIGIGKVGGKDFDIEVEYNHDWDGYLSRAYLVKEYWESHQNDSPGTKRYAMKLGIFSQYHAYKIISNFRAPATHMVNHRVFCIGDPGVSCTSGELFNQLGVKARSENPFPVPISLSYTGGTTGYYPSEYAYDYGCYECDNNSHRKGSSEKVIAAQIEALKELYKQFHK